MVNMIIDMNQIFIHFINIILHHKPKSAVSPICEIHICTLRYVLIRYIGTGAYWILVVNNYFAFFSYLLGTILKVYV